jgi:hypothetical protein
VAAGVTDPITLTDLLRRPKAVVAAIGAQVVGAEASLIEHASNLVAIRITFAPPLELKPHGYPDEAVRIVQLADTSRHPLPYALPEGPPRTWEHRYPVSAPLYIAPLCLWYPDDPPALRWDWSQDFLTYVAIVQRHLWSEEYYRRTERWPAEDAPHGHRPDGAPHPIRSIHNFNVTRTTP